MPDVFAGQTERVERGDAVAVALAQDSQAGVFGDEEVDFVAEFGWEEEERAVWLGCWSGTG